MLKLVKKVSSSRKGCTEKRARHGHWKQSQQEIGEEVGMQNENMNTQAREIKFQGAGREGKTTSNPAGGLEEVMVCRKPP